MGRPISDGREIPNVLKQLTNEYRKIESNEIEMDGGKMVLQVYQYVTNAEISK